MKTKTKAQAQMNEAFQHTIKTRRAAGWGIILRAPGCTLPTTEQLSHLAAQLAHGGPVGDGRHLCASALTLWHTANEALDIQRKANEEGQLESAAMADYRAKHPDPAPSDFPMDLDGFLYWVWRGKDTAERNELFKLWLGYVLKMEIKSPTKDDVARRYIEARKEAIDLPRFYYLRNSLADWHAKIYSQEVSQRRSEAGKVGGKAKRKARPPVISKAEMEALTHSAEK
jgi:hypothetical protein